MLDLHRRDFETEGQYKARIANDLAKAGYPAHRCYEWAGDLWEMHYSPTGPQFPF